MSRMKSFLKLTLLLFCQGVATTDIKDSIHKKNVTNNCIVFSGNDCLRKHKELMEIPSKPMSIDVDIQPVQITEVDDVRNTITFTTCIGLAWKEIACWQTQLYQEIDEKWNDYIWSPEIWILGLGDIKVFETRKSYRLTRRVVSGRSKYCLLRPRQLFWSPCMAILQV